MCSGPCSDKTDRNPACFHAIKLLVNKMHGPGVQETFGLDRLRKMSVAGCVAAMFVASLQPASARTAEPVAAAVPQLNTAAIPANPDVGAFYEQWSGPRWFDNDGEAAAQLALILRRSVLDGVTNGPAMAADVETASALAARGTDSERAAAQKVLSAAWVSYVEAIQRPVPNMIYGYETLRPTQDGVDRVLSAAATAPSLADHLASVSAINPMYAELRDTAWIGMKANPGSMPDQRVLMNLARLRSLPQASRFALVNIATQRLTMVEGGRAVDSMKVIVGMSDLPTPMISSVIYYVTHNPYWNVPDHLVRNTVAPNVLLQGTGYLKDRGYQVMSDWSESASVVPANQIDWKAVASGARTIRLRQLPGPGNSMGDLKFSFANGEGIFLHDTPSKDLFAKSERNLSNGCVRLEDARRFGQWLLGKPPVPPSAEPEEFEPLPSGVPVYFTYLTAEPVNGSIVYANDIYDWDKPHVAMAAPAHAGPSPLQRY